MSYNSQEIKALAAPFWGMDMDDLRAVVVIGFTTTGGVVFIDSTVGGPGPASIDNPTPTATRAQAATVAQHMCYALDQILAGCVFND